MANCVRENKLTSKVSVELRVHSFVTVRFNREKSRRWMDGWKRVYCPRGTKEHDTTAWSSIITSPMIRNIAVMKRTTKERDEKTGQDSFSEIRAFISLRNKTVTANCLIRVD